MTSRDTDADQRAPPDVRGNDARHLTKGGNTGMAVWRLCQQTLAVSPGPLEALTDSASCLLSLSLTAEPHWWDTADAEIKVFPLSSSLLRVFGSTVKGFSCVKPGVG